MDRREFIKTSILTFSIYSLLSEAFMKNAFALEIRSNVEKWAIGLQNCYLDLKGGRLSVDQWRLEMDALYTSVPLSDILTYIKFEQLKKSYDWSRKENFGQKVDFPKIDGFGDPWKISRLLFGLKRRTAIVPHGHNNMVSAHFVLSGNFRVRTYNRCYDKEISKEPFLYLTPSLDRQFIPAELLAMSELDDNVQWLVAETDEAYTFDIPLTKLPSIHTDKVSNSTNSSRIYLDPLNAVKDSGKLSTPVMSESDAIKKYAHV